MFYSSLTSPAQNKPEAISIAQFSPALRLGDLPWRYSVYLCAFLATALLTFLFMGTYTRRVPTVGQVVIDRGLVRLSSPQVGFIKDIALAEGAKVNAGQLVFSVEAQRRSSQGVVQDTIIAQLQERQDSLNKNQVREKQLLKQRIGDLQQRMKQLQNQLNQNERRQILAKNRIELAKTQLERHQNLMVEGFISLAAKDDKESVYLDAQNSLALLQSEEIEIRNQWIDLKSQFDTLPLQSMNVRGELDRDIAALKSSQAEQLGSKEVLIVAPKEGRISNVSARPGQLVTPEMNVLDIVPEDAVYQVELYTTSKGIGFIEENQIVSLRFEAFPYQKFGVQKGRVISIGRTTNSSEQISIPLPEEENYYRIAVALERQFIEAYGKRQNLQIGMKVEADVRTDTRTIWQWLMEPLYGIKGRL